MIMSGKLLLLLGTKISGNFVMISDITDDVLGHLTEGEVDWVMLQVQQL